MARRSLKPDEVRGAGWALALMAFLLAALALAAWLTRMDKANRSELDSFVKSSQPLPTPVPRPQEDEEMDPDKDEKQ